MVPLAAIESPDCEAMYNFNQTDAGISLRPGDLELVNLASSSSTTQGVCFAQYGQIGLFAIATKGSTSEVLAYSAEAGTLEYTSTFIFFCSS
jgi:hypothetical protein